MGSEIGLRLRHMKGAGAESNGYGYGHVATGEYTTFNMKRRGASTTHLITANHRITPYSHSNDCSLASSSRT